MQTLQLAVFFAVLAGLAALGRRASPAGQRRNVLSVALVVLGLIAAFLLCFFLGSLVRDARAAHAAPHATTTTVIKNVLASSAPPCSSRSTT